MLAKNLKSQIATVLFPLWFLFALALSVQAADTVSITFKVKVPLTTPPSSKLYIAGNANTLGSWAAPGVELKRGDGGAYVATVAVPKDQPLEFKITRGSWETVEKNSDGSEMLNRTLVPRADSTQELTVTRWADTGKTADAPAPGATPAAGEPPKPPRKSTKTGDIRTHENFHAEIMVRDRNLYVYLPPGYEANKDARYPVLYMHDGQNVFDQATNPLGGDEWRADETAEKLIKDGKIEPLIIVGICNTDQRMNEYTWSADPQRKLGGWGEKYVKFVADDVKPFIDKTYRTKPDRANTAAAGSSLGATISLEMCRARADTFGKCAALSPSLWWASGDLPKRIEADPAWVKNCRIWSDIGSVEAGEASGQLVAQLRAFREILRNAGAVEEKDFHLEVISGAHHEEKAWAARFDRVLMFLFPAN